MRYETISRAQCEIAVRGVPLFLCLRQHTLLLYDHTEAPPKVVTSLPALWQESFFFLASQNWRRRREFDVALFDSFRGTHKGRSDWRHSERERVRGAGNADAWRRHPRRGGAAEIGYQHKWARVLRRLLSAYRRCSGAGRSEVIERGDGRSITWLRGSKGNWLGTRLVGAVTVIERVLLVVGINVQQSVPKVSQGRFAVGIVFNVLVIPAGL